MPPLTLHQSPPALSYASPSMSRNKAELVQVKITRGRDFPTSQTSRWAAWGHGWSPLWLSIGQSPGKGLWGEHRAMSWDKVTAHFV